jgi:flagellar hook-associated protein 3 FlgL
MRITENHIVSQFLLNLGKTRSRIDLLNLQLSAQKKILKVSDDPEGASAVLRLDGDLSRNDQYSRSVTDGQSMLKTTADSLQTAADAVQTVKGVVAGSVNLGDPQLITQLADQVDHYLDTLLDVANTQFNGKYIFAGTNTTTAPFVLQTVGNPPSQTVAYTGNAGQIQYQVGEGIFQAVNVDGQSAFMSGRESAEMVFSGNLDPNASTGTTLSMTRSITDSLGVQHNVVVTFTKAGANSWNIGTAMPAGATDATVSGGTATVTFDPATGTVASTSSVVPLTITPTGTGAAPVVTTNLIPSGLTQAQSLSLTVSGTTPSNGVNFGGLLDPQAAVNTTLNITGQVRDSLGSAHDVVFSFTKTAPNTWQVATLSATGATVSGGTGTATLTFDPATGALTGPSPSVPLQLTGLSSGAPDMTVTLGAGTVAEQQQVNAVARAESIFNKLIEIRDNLRQGIVPTADDIAMLTSMQQTIMEKQASAGAMSQTLNLAQTHLVTQREHLLSLRSSKQDVDLAQIGMELNQEQTMLEAALSAGARIMQKSLLDFLT